jgi:hypothetical protein
MENDKIKLAKTLSIVVFVFFAIDFGGFIMWAMSGQTPADGFYIGAITKNLLALIF